MSKQPIPSFYLYGEPHRLVDGDFVHVETLEDRSRPSEWTIQPHSHGELMHVFVILDGGGVMTADGVRIRLSAPSLLIMPPTIVHGFEFLEDTEGFVVTMASSYVAELSRHDTRLAEFLDRPRAVELEQEDGPRVEGLVADLRRELSWSAPGHRATVTATMLLLLITGLRRLGVSTRASPRTGTHASIVARLRERIEQRFRLREPVSAHARALGVSQTALRVACARIAGRSPGQMLDQRALLEAQRSLLYTGLSVAEIGFSLGFRDPAYFSRFFQRNTGMSPRRYRETRRPETRIAHAASGDMHGAGTRSAVGSGQVHDPTRKRVPGPA